MGVENRYKGACTAAAGGGVDMGESEYVTGATGATGTGAAIVGEGANPGIY